MSAPSWHISPNDFERILDNDGEWVAESMVGTVAHIARHDPARVLAECQAKRRIVECHRPDISLNFCVACFSGDFDRLDEPEHEVWPCPTLRILATVYAAHSDYQREWRP